MKRIDEMEHITIDGIPCCQGHTLPFGATILNEDMINFSVHSADAEGCALQLYHTGEKEPYADITIPNKYRIGNVYSIIVFGQNPEDLEYTYRFYGRMEPESGYYFDPRTRLLDPYSKLLSGREKWGQNPIADHPLHSKVLIEDFPWQGDQPLEIPFEDLVIYEMHVRGFTNDPASPAKRKGTFAGVVEMIPYLKDLGVNCVELLPVFEFDEMDGPTWVPGGDRLYNFWGYQTLSFFAPKAGYAQTGSYGMAADEMKTMIRQLHRNGIEVILDVVFNHTGEGGPDHQTLNYRGIDNRIYYLMDKNGRYLDYSGCGNTMNCNNVVVRRHIVDCLRYWVSEFHVDGFRFDEAPILSRDTEGKPMKNPPLLDTLAYDSILARTKLIAEAWDAGGLYQVGNFPGPDKWAEWNGRFRDCVRLFVKSDANVGPELIARLQGSPDMYHDREKTSTVNFITCHDGFTLNDLVSYNEKHNIANGEDNRDGANDNNSWNCGVEGPTDDPEIEALRNRQVKNAFALLMLSRGTPMMLAGDEFRNSQQGNNNPYCQDSPLSWVNWAEKDAHEDVFQFFRAMIHLRRNHPVLRRRDYYTAHNSSGYPELSFHGEQAWNINIHEPFHTFGFMYAEPMDEFGTEKDCFIYCGVNAHWEQHRLELPQLPYGMAWYMYADTAVVDAEKIMGYEIPKEYIDLTPRSLKVLVGRQAPTSRNR